MKKYKLTKFGKTILILLVVIVLSIIIYERYVSLTKIANTCDKVKGYTCSLYEIKNFKYERD